MTPQKKKGKKIIKIQFQKKNKINSSIYQNIPLRNEYTSHRPRENIHNTVHISKKRLTSRIYLKKKKTLTTQ